MAAQTGNEYPGCPVSVMLAGMLKNRNSVRLKNELAIERVRQLRHPNQVSRLVGMYFFEDSAALKEITEWGAHFSPEYQTELGIFPGANLSRHDANWVTFAPLDRQGSLATVDWIDYYWAGEPFPKRAPVWELIVNGRAAVYGTNLRERAYRNLRSEFPECLAILEAGRIAAYLNSDFGQVAAWVTRTSKSELSLEYYLDMRDAHNPQFLQSLKGFDGKKNHADLAIGGGSFAVPDFRRFAESFQTTDEFSAQFFAGVHGNSS